MSSRRHVARFCRDFFSSFGTWDISLLLHVNAEDIFRIQNLEVTGFPQISRSSRKNSPFLSLHLLRSMIHMKHDQPLRGVQHRVGFFVDFRGQLRSGSRQFWYVLMVRMLSEVNQKRDIHQPKRRLLDDNHTNLMPHAR